jgi:hypothetical protein
MCGFCSSAVEFIHLLWCCTSSPGDLVPNIAEQFYCPIFRDIWPLKMEPPHCPQTVGMITQWCDVVSWKTGEVKILCLCHMWFSRYNCVFVSCCPVCTTNLKPYPSSQLLSFNCTNRIRRSLVMKFVVMWFVFAITAAPVRCDGLLNFVVWDL